MPRLAAVLLGAALAAAGAAPAGAETLSEAARWLQAYLRIDTSNPPGREAEGAAWLAGLLHREGVATRLLVTPEGRTSLWARLPGRGERPGLVLLHHLDAVPPGPGWSLPPLAAEVHDAALYGRGAVDDKSLGIAHLAAFVELRRRRLAPAGDVVFLAVADEETGGARGAGWLLERHPDLFAGVGAVLAEGGANRVAAGGGAAALRWWGIEVAQKRPLWLRVRAEGREGHGSSLNLHSAPHRLVRALARLLALPPAYRVTPEARRYFAALAPFESPALAALFTHLDDAIGPAGPRRSLPPGLPNYLLDSLQVNVLTAGETLNATPATASALIDARLLPGTDADAFLAALRAALAPDATAEVLLTAPASSPSSTATDAYHTLEQVLRPTAPVVPAFIPGVTDSRYFRERGIPAYGFSPFALDGEDLRGVHGPDEHIPLATFDRGVEVMRRVVERYATGG